MGTATIERVRKRFVCEGLEAALGRQHGGGQRKCLDGNSEAHLLAVSPRASAAAPLAANPLKVEKDGR